MIVTLDIDSFPKVLARIFAGEATVMERMRLGCTFTDSNDRRIDGGEDIACGREGAPMTVLNNSLLIHCNPRVASDE